MAYSNPGWRNNTEPAIDADALNSLSNAVQQLSVSNGGTGKTSVTSGAMLKGNGADPLQELSGTGALYAQTANNPQFGILPVNCGGTGAATVSGIRSALGLETSGFIVSDTAPGSTNCLWIDTANHNIIKFYKDGAWEACGAVFG
jgi:hypothetical protein